MTDLIYVTRRLIQRNAIRQQKKRIRLRSVAKKKPAKKSKKKKPKVLVEQIKSTGDSHHVFIEGIHKVGNVKVKGKSVGKWEILLGS